MIKRRYQTGRKSILQIRDLAWLALIAAVVVFGATTWRQAYVEAAPAQEYQEPVAPEGIGVPELGPPARAQPSS